MKVKKILEKLLIIYFVGMGIFFEFGVIVSLFVFLNQENDNGLITSAIQLSVFGLLFLYSSTSLIKAKVQSYRNCIVTLAIVFVLTTLHRLIFITNFNFERVDINNLLLFGVPFLTLLYLMYFDRSPP